MDVIDRYLPDRDKHAPVRSMLAFLAVNSTYKGPATPGSALCLAFALASPGDATMSKVEGGLGTMSKHVLDLFETHGGTLRLHTKVAKILVSEGTVRGVELSDGDVVTAPVVVSNLDPSSTFFGLLEGEDLPDALIKRVGAIDHRAAYFQIHFALGGLPEYIGPYEVLNDPSYSQNVTFFGTAEQMQRDFEDCVLGRMPASPSFNLQIPSIHEPSLAPPDKHAGSTFAFYFPIGANHDQQIRLRDEMANRIVAKVARVAPNFPELIERQLNYPAYTYELMFGCTGSSRSSWVRSVLDHEDGATCPSRSRACTSVVPVAPADPGSRSSPVTTAVTRSSKRRARLGRSAAGVPRRRGTWPSRRPGS